MVKKGFRFVKIRVVNRYLKPIEFVVASLVNPSCDQESIALDYLFEMRDFILDDEFDFDEEDFYLALESFAGRERRYGGLQNLNKI